MSGKSSWPELLGVQATPAVMAIANDRPDVSIPVLPPGVPFDGDPNSYNPTRVRVYIDDSSIVNRVPVVG